MEKVHVRLCVFLKFQSGKLNIHYGTSVLLALLGELEVTSGTVDLPRAISYCAQHPWLESTTIRDNMCVSLSAQSKQCNPDWFNTCTTLSLFGSPYIHRRYRDIIEACALLPDLVLFPDGDLTHIGQRGVALSGNNLSHFYTTIDS